MAIAKTARGAAWAALRPGRSWRRADIAAKDPMRVSERLDIFTGEEWALVRLAPALASSCAAHCDSSQLAESTRRAAAEVRAMAEVFVAGRDLRLFNALAADCSTPRVPDAKTLFGEGPREQQMCNFKTDVLARVRAAVDLVDRKGSSAEATAYRALIVTITEKAANSSPDSGRRGGGDMRPGTRPRAEFVSAVKRATGLA